MEVTQTAVESSSNLPTQIITFFLIFLVAILALMALIVLISKLWPKFVIKKKIAGKKEEDHVILFVRIPSNNDKKENAMEDFLKSLHRILDSSSYISLEMSFSQQFLKFFIVVPKKATSAVESQLYAQYPDAEIEEASEYLPTLTENSAVYELNYKKSSLQPLNTYKDAPESILKNMSALLSKADPADHIILQIIIHRVGSKGLDRGLSGLLFNLFGKKITSKYQEDLYSGQARLIYKSRDKSSAEAKINTLIGLFKSLKSPYNEIKKRKININKGEEKTIRYRLFEKGSLWSAQELATLYHFPYKDSLVSNVVMSNSKRAPAPDILPAEGITPSQEMSLIGETDYRNAWKRFGLKRVDRRRHLYVIGKSGTGKSRLLELLLISDIRQGQGCCLLDPHGDLADELLMFVPKERINDVVYINPADRDYPIGFNPLEPVDDYEMRQHLSTFFIAIFKKLFAATWNPRMEHLIRYITLALLETPDSNILGIPRILSDTAFRQRVVKQIQDPVVKAFWTNEFAAWNQQFANDAVVPILNKVGQFIANPVVRNVVGQRHNNLDFEKFMNEGKIVIINISKGKLGDDNAALLGSMFITKIQQAALSRAKMKEEDRKDFYFYVDEFQNFATDAFSTILSEARKYRLNLTIAHQYIAQLPEDVKATAFGNVGSIIAFAIGGDDASYLAKEFAPIFSAEDMIGLNVREMYLKVSIDGKTTPPFSARTIDVPKPNFDYSSDIFNHSRLTYGTNRVAVENEIARWSSSVDLIDDSGKTKEEFPEPII